MFEVAVDYLVKLANSDKYPWTQSLSPKSPRKLAKLLRGLELSIESDGVYDAIKARQRPPEAEHLPQNGTPLLATNSIKAWGRLIRPEDMDDSSQLLVRSGWSTLDDVRILLPRQAQPGDWLIAMSFPSVPLVARQESLGNFAIIGKCVTVSGRLSRADVMVHFRVLVDIEDMVVLLLSRPKRKDLESDHWIREYLGTRVCRTPGSSYATLYEPPCTEADYNWAEGTKQLCSVDVC
ncbi:hypothetical protein VM1G_10234 [Cytospora mali]|uniref:Uncharacterized protein n=1 Tax=Cytospora mali TaxID=578113 RepID=A0A194VH94_CYTMA|nr:hypothetical protein VM1G_10234 [Valsa mali]